MAPPNPFFYFLPVLSSYLSSNTLFVVPFLISIPPYPREFHYLKETMNKLSAYYVLYRRALAIHLITFCLDQTQVYNSVCPTLFQLLLFCEEKYKAVLERTTGLKIYHLEHFLHILCVVIFFAISIIITHRVLSD